MSDSTWLLPASIDGYLAYNNECPCCLEMLKHTSRVLREEYLLREVEKAARALSKTLGDEGFDGHLPQWLSEALDKLDAVRGGK